MFVPVDRCSDIFEYFALAYANTKLQTLGGDIDCAPATEKLDYGSVSPVNLVRALSQAPDTVPVLAGFEPSWSVLPLVLQVFSQEQMMKATQAKLDPIKKLMNDAISFGPGGDNSTNQRLLRSTITIHSQHPTNYCAYILGFVCELAKDLNQKFAGASREAKIWAKEFFITANHFLFFVAKQIEAMNRVNREFLMKANNGECLHRGETHIPSLLMNARVGGAIRYRGHGHRGFMNQYHWFEKYLLRITEQLNWSDEERGRLLRVII